MKTQPYSNRGFTLVELLVVIVIILALAAGLTSVGRGMMARSRTLNCAKNLRQLGIASMMYAADNQMKLPATSHQRGGKSWTLTLQAALQPYSKEPIAFKCPDDPDEKRERSYAINDFLTANPAGADHLNFSILSKVSRPEVTLLFAESAASDSSDHFHFAPYYGGNVPPAVFEYQVASARHAGSANYLFADGHVETLSKQETRARLARAGTCFLDPSGGK